MRCLLHSYTRKGQLLIDPGLSNSIYSSFRLESHGEKREEFAYEIRISWCTARLELSLKTSALGTKYLHFASRPCRMSVRYEDVQRECDFLTLIAPTSP